MAIPSNLPQRANIKAFYKLDEVSGNRADETIGEHTATDVNTVGSDTGKINLGALFVATNLEHFTIVDHADLKPTGNFSISFSYKHDGTPSSGQKLFQSYAEADSKTAGWLISIEASGTIRVMSCKNTGVVENTDWAKVESTTNICDNALHHVMFTSDGTNLKVYIDENTTPEGTTGWANTPVYQTPNYIRIGCLCQTGTNSAYIDGLLDELILWNGAALTGSESLQVYNISKYSYTAGFLLNMMR